MLKTRFMVIVLIVALCMTVGISVFGAKSEVLRVGHIFPTNHITHRALTQFKEVVEKETNGGLTIEIYPLGQLGKGETLSQNIMLGTVDMGTAGPGLLSRLEPSFAIWGAEYMFKDVDSMFKVIKSPVGKEIFDRLRTKKGIRVLGSGYLGERHLTTTDTPVRTPAHLKGMKIRIPGIPYRRAAFLALGASPTPVAFSELYLALQQNVVDGQENPLPQIYSMKFYEVQKYLILTGHAQNPEMLMINDDKFRSLPKDYQEALLAGAEVYETVTRKLVAEETAELLEKLKNEGMTVIEPDIEAFREAVKDVPYQFEDEWGKGLYEKVLEAQK